MNSKLHPLIISAVAIIMSACSSQLKIAETTFDTNMIPYTIAGHYFINNDADSVPTVINNGKDFNRYFSMAAVMGKGGQPTPIDFSKEYVIAVTMPDTDRTTYISPLSLIRDGNGNIVFHCNAEIGDKQSYIMRPLLLAAVSRKYKGDVSVRLTCSPELWIIYYDTGIGDSGIRSTIANIGATIVYDYKNFNAVAVKFPPSLHTDEALRTLESAKGVLSIQPNRNITIE